ncbi:hypothetical protein NHX12_011615 [Muraenolepis orangiensis]|uniref:Uncharacterized protein n=1 Tax=Muraenolepis orangiensis TaxID=630683 RepID=A0A9Q0DGQ0_9TELE|nr:hypothetical protein NHX12_011615 [Muraenolepis orangiensis]
MNQWRLDSRHASRSLWRLGGEAAGGGGGGGEEVNPSRKKCWRQPAELFTSTVGSRSDNCGGSDGSRSSAGSALPLTLTQFASGMLGVGVPSVGQSGAWDAGAKRREARRTPVGGGGGGGRLASSCKRRQ